MMFYTRFIPKTGSLDIKKEHVKHALFFAEITQIR